VNKKTIIIITLLLVSAIILSGCINNDKPTKSNNNNLDNSSPFAIIKAPEKAYFGNPVMFDASDSYDSGGNIVSYEWNFRDGQTAKGKKVEHTFKFENEFDIEYPLIYTVLLCVEDNDKSFTLVEHQIMLFPSKYILYLNSGKIITNKPSSNEDTLRASGKFKIKPAQDITYEFKDYIKVQKCNWNVTIFMKKPLLAVVDSILVTLFNKTGVEISKAETSFGQFEIWKEKTVSIQGETDKLEEFKSLKISLYGFSFGKKINILYGGETASQMCFDFTI
jgi:hypothetical protein